MHFETVDRLPNIEFGYWDETLPTWHTQGLPESVNSEEAAYAYFGIEAYQKAPVMVRLDPPFEMEIVEETSDYLIRRDVDYALRKDVKQGARSIPHYLEYGIRSRSDWPRFRERLNPATPGRYPENWETLVEEYRTRDYPLAIRIGSMIGLIRNWIGFEGLALLAYDDPDFLEEMIEACCVCVCGTIERALGQVAFDFAAGWEDICFKNGPILSPVMFDRWIVPRYKRITDLLHQHGVDIVWTDCDGNINPIVNQFLAGGINCMFPLEVAGGSDPVALRETYGKNILLHGGVDKMVLLRGEKAIEKELLRLKPVVEEGGFIPLVDHKVPSNVTLANYKTYLRLKRDLFNAGDLVPHYEA